MSRDAVERIELELVIHPKERVGFDKSDFDALDDVERMQLVRRFFMEVEEGHGYSEQLKWLLGEDYVSGLKTRLSGLPQGAHGRVYLPYFIFLATQERKFIQIMMRETVLADPAWEGRRHAIPKIHKLIGTEVFFWDFCRYVIIHVPQREMKTVAMRWLAVEKGYPLDEWQLTPELEECVDDIATTGVPSLKSRVLLEQIHPDAGTFDLGQLMHI